MLRFFTAFRSMLCFLALCFLFLLQPTAAFSQEPKAAPARTEQTRTEKATEKDSEITEEEAKLQQQLISDIRQVTFSGRRAGEGYFSKDGKQMVFQSEREPGNPFYQIYLMDRELGDIHRISPGVGKTTCAWIHPDGNRILFSSTQYDPEAVAKQDAELEFRKSGQSRRYSWDYDKTYELVEFDVKKQEYRRLSDQEGYDAEGSYSPDGKQICFASNRRAYTGELTDEEKTLFDQDPASAMDLYITDVDGGNLLRLTDAVGYDGGPFFSPDGKQICWRRFTKDGATAEIMVMNTDGSNQRSLTKLGAMSWAPFFHPSGEYIVFTTNIHGFANFELYMIDVAGNSKPQRVTYRSNFDGLPVFTPNGKSLVWTSNGQSSQSQIYEASWNHQHARKLLGLNESTQVEASSKAASQSAEATAVDITAGDIGRHVDYLCRPELGGRLTGTQGEILATSYVAAYLEHLGLKPAGDNGTFFHQFEFVADIKLGSDSQLVFGDRKYEVDKDWRPLSFSRKGDVSPADIVFAGYGIVAPKAEGQPMYDSYVHLDVEDKWVVMFRRMPANITPERRQYFAGFSHDRYKAMMARERGAKGVIFVSGPTSQFKTQLIPLRMDGSMGASSLAVISVTDAVAEPWFKAVGEDMKKLQEELDGGEMMMGIALEGGKLAGNIDIEPVTNRGRNVAAILPAGDAPTQEMIVVGAHIDHLGSGTGSSLAKESELGAMHLGADDNASGVSCMLEIAQYLSHQKKQGKLSPKRDMLFAAWSGEELGLHGSAAFVNDFAKLYPERMKKADVANSESSEKADSAGKPAKQKLYPQIAAYLNMDMVGRLRDNLILQGLGSSPYWTGAIEQRNAVVRLPLTLQQDCHLPTDATSFFLRGVPILAAFTGSHDEYHTPRDLPQLLNYDGASQVAKLMALITRDLALLDTAPEYQEQAAEPEMRANLTAYLGTVPDYGQTDIQGVKLGGVTKGAPAEKAGLLAGDIIIELAGRKIENIYDYTYAIEALKIGETIKLKAKRGEKVVELDVTPASRN
jgi:Tol biopolymer transport system component